MSTSDMVLLISLNNKKKKLNKKISGIFNKLEKLMTTLSHYIVKDGGGKKFISIKVTGTDSKENAKKIAFQSQILHFLKLLWQDRF